jgi:hypothetical protein
MYCKEGLDNAKPLRREQALLCALVRNLHATSVCVCARVFVCVLVPACAYARARAQECATACACSSVCVGGSMRVHAP